MKNFHNLREELSLLEDAELIKHHQTMMKKHAAARDYHHASDDGKSDHHQDAGMAHHNAHGDHEHALSMLKKHGKDHKDYKSAAGEANSMSKGVKSDYGT